MGMAARALAQAERAVDLDPGQEACVTMALDAGWVRSHGAWAREVDVLAADGKVRYQGRIMTISAADGLKASARKQAALAAAQQLVDERVHAVAYCDRLLAEIGTRSPDLEIELTMAKADVAIAEATPAKVYAARTALDSAQANLDQARSSPPSGSPATASSYLASYDQAVTSAQVALAAAKKAEAGAAADLPRLRGRVGALTDEKRNLERKLNDLGLKRAAALKAQAQARSDAARAADDEQGTADRTAASAIPAATAAPSAASSAPSAAKP
jgi:chromosome segregation ATPase